MADHSPNNFEAIHEQRDWLLVTLSSIGDAVITTDVAGQVTFLNPVAESLTGWTQDAVGQPLDSVIRIINEESREPVEIPTADDGKEHCPAEARFGSTVSVNSGRPARLVFCGPPLET